MQTTLNAAVQSYLRAKGLSRGTRNECFSTLRKWEQWGNGVSIEELRRRDIREFLDWVYERAVADEGTNPGRTANKAREHLRAVISWAWELELIDSPPRFPMPRTQRDVAGRHYLTKPEINALYFATHKMERPRGWDHPISIGRYWRSALVVFFNYGLDTGTDPGLFEIDPATKKVTAIDAQIGTPLQPSVSPDGKTIAFVTGNKIWLIDRDGKNLRQLLQDGRNQQRPVFSPDGTKIAFIVCNQLAVDASGEVFVIDLKTQEITLLRTSAGSSLVPDTSTRLNWIP